MYMYAGLCYVCVMCELEFVLAQSPITVSPSQLYSDEANQSLSLYKV